MRKELDLNTQFIKNEVINYMDSNSNADIDDVKKIIKSLDFEKSTVEIDDQAWSWVQTKTYIDSDGNEFKTGNVNSIRTYFNFLFQGKKITVMQRYVKNSDDPCRRFCSEDDCQIPYAQTKSIVNSVNIKDLFSAVLRATHCEVKSVLDKYINSRYMYRSEDKMEIIL